MLSIFPVKGIPYIKKGDELGKMIVEKVEDQGDEFQRGDIAIISQKVVSKAEGRVLPLSKIKPSDFAETIAKIMASSAPTPESTGQMSGQNETP